MTTNNIEETLTFYSFYSPSFKRSESKPDYTPYVDIIFENYTRFLPEPDSHFKTDSWTIEMCVEKCLLEYVYSFRRKVVRYCVNGLAPALNDHFLNTIHEEALSNSRIACRHALFKLQSRKDHQEALHLFDVALGNILTHIRDKNEVRKEIPKQFAETKIQEFQNCLKEKYESLFGNQGKNGKFYDQTCLEEFVNSRKKHVFDDIQVFTDRFLLQTSDNDTEFEKLRSDTILFASNSVTEKCSLIISKNIQNCEVLKENLRQLIAHLESDSLQVQNNLKQNPFSDFDSQAFANLTDNCKERLNELCKLHAMENYVALIEEFTLKADQVYENIARNFERQRRKIFATLIQNVRQDFPAFFFQKAKKLGAPGECFEEFIKATVKFMGDTTIVETACRNYESRWQIVSDGDTSDTLETPSTSPQGANSDDTEPISNLEPPSSSKSINKRESSDTGDKKSHGKKAKN